MPWDRAQDSFSKEIAYFFKTDLHETLIAHYLGCFLSGNSSFQNLPLPAVCFICLNLLPCSSSQRTHYLTLSWLFTFCLTVSLLHLNVSSRAHRILVHHMSPDVQCEGIPHWSVCERRKYHIHKQYKHSQQQVPKKRNKLMNRDSLEKLVPMD